MTITGAPSATTTRDLAALVGLGALRRTGELKATRYQLNISIDEIQSIDFADFR
jgi:DNA-binding IclR family transcriptional regulator